MKFTLDDCMSRINQALNYPSLSYTDIYHFFDQAIEELNSTFRIALPTVSEMNAENTFSIADQSDIVKLSSQPSASGMSSAPAKYAFYIGTDRIPKYYVAVPIGGLYYWNAIEREYIEKYDLTEYMPLTWWILFVIPYVCFKYTVRDGDSGAHFMDEFSQGFQQLQTSYNVPNKVNLSSVAHKHAYKPIVQKCLPNLNTTVFTRAIYDDMRVGNGIMPTYGGFYETGGWNV